MKGITKAVDRAGTSILQKTGSIEKTVDKEYEDEEKRYRTLESKVEKLQKEAKGYLDAVRAMTIAQQRIADTINQFYNESSRYSQLGLKYKDVSNELDEQVRVDMDKDYRESVLDPLQEFTGYFPRVNEVIKKRQKKLLDYDGQRGRVRKLAEKPSEDADKLPRAQEQMNEMREHYETVNAQLVEDLPKLINARVPYIDPTFEALLKCQLKFASDTREKFRELKQALTGMTNCESSDGRVDQVLQQLRDLSIVPH